MSEKQEPIEGQSHWCDGWTADEEPCHQIVRHDSDHCEAGHSNKIRIETAGSEYAGPPLGIPAESMSVEELTRVVPRSLRRSSQSGAEQVRRDPLRYAIRQILIDHLIAIQDRDKLKTETTLPDLSDIYDETERRLRSAFVGNVPRDQAGAQGSRTQSDSPVRILVPQRWIDEVVLALDAASSISVRSCRYGDGLAIGNHDRLIEEAHEEGWSRCGITWAKRRRAEAMCVPVSYGTGGRTEPCCVGIPSGYLTPNGTVALMCDDECQCATCVEQCYACGNPDDVCSVHTAK